MFCAKPGDLFPWTIQCRVLLEGRGVQVCQADLGGLPSPFLQELPDLLSGPKKQGGDYCREGEAEATKPDPPPAMFQGWAQQEQMGMPVPVAWP